MPFSFAKSLCAALLIGSPALSQDLIGFDLSSFGRTVLSNDQAAGGDIMLEAAFGAYNNEFIATYSSKSIFAKMGRSVGRLDVATDAGVFPCTAFLVDEDLLMTNHHCVPGILDNDRAGATAIVGVQFVAGYLQEGIEEGSERFLVNPVPVETSKPLDYTLLRVLGAKPGRTYGQLALAGDSPDDNAPFWIIGHPMGEAQRISREKCRANAPALSNDRVLHTCDTLPGNSGSPVIDAGTQQVIALHHAGSARNSINYAVPMAAILRNSKFLKSATPLAPASTKPDPEGLASLSLMQLFGLEDGDALETGLKELMTEFPGTKAAKQAQRRLDRLNKTRKQADKQDQTARANDALLAALVLTDAKAQRRALERLVKSYGNTPAAAAARSTLAVLNQPAPVVPDTPQTTPQTTPPKTVVTVTPPTTTPPKTVNTTKAPTPTLPDSVQQTTVAKRVYDPGSVLLVSSFPVYRSPSLQSRVVTRASGSVTLGAHVSDNWYRVENRTGEYVQVRSGLKILVASQAAPVIATTTKPGILPNNTKLKISGSLAAYSSPSTGARKVKTVFGLARISRHISDGWYQLDTTQIAYVKPSAKDIAAHFAGGGGATTATPTTATPTTAKPGILPNNTKLKISSSLAAYSSPSTGARKVKTVFGLARISRHISNGWYQLDTTQIAYVKPSAKDIAAHFAGGGGATTGKDQFFTYGTIVKSGSRPIREKPVSYAPVVSNVTGNIKVGTHVFGDWYRMFYDRTKYVELPQGLTIVSGGRRDK